MSIWIPSGLDGFQRIDAAEEPRDTHPIRLIVSTFDGSDWAEPQEHAFTDVSAANTWLEDLGETCEDIELMYLEGCTPPEVGFEQGY